jgi:hypothetical protein
MSGLGVVEGGVVCEDAKLVASLGGGEAETFGETDPAFSFSLVATTKDGAAVSNPRLKTWDNDTIHTGLGSSSLIAHVLHSPPPPPREQLCNRSCSNKHTHTLR